MKKEILDKAFDKYIRVDNELRETSLQYLNDALDSTETNRIDLLDEDGDGEYVSITYDGGNHPEYASNAYSRVISVFRKPNDTAIYFEIEDCEEYEDSRVCTSELFDVASLISENEKKYIH